MNCKGGVNTTYCVVFFFQMDLRRRIAELESCHYLSVRSLEPDRTYSILRAERMQTKYGPTIVLTLVDSPERLVRVFLPRRFYSVFTEDDNSIINTSKDKLSLICKGTCIDTKAFKIANE
jgi:hypothetical protein